jgi:hypothetical protein
LDNLDGILCRPFFFFSGPTISSTVPQISGLQDLANSIDGQLHEAFPSDLQTSDKEKCDEAFTSVISYLVRSSITLVALHLLSALLRIHFEGLFAAMEE